MMNDASHSTSQLLAGGVRCDQAQPGWTGCDRKANSVSQILDPLADPVPDEVPLPHAPLVRVIAQVRFPPVMSIERPDFVGPFQEAIRSSYPVLRPEREVGTVVGAQGLPQMQSGSIWRFHDSPGIWRASLSTNFLALETIGYTSRDDFLARLVSLLQALDAHIGLGLVDRLGVRYIDRIPWEGPVAARSMVRPEIMGVLAAPFADASAQAVTETVFRLGQTGSRLKARWGTIPAHHTIDPATLEPVDESTWVLDLDAFTTEARPMDVDSIATQARHFAERIYAFYRWSVTDEFLRRYGGEV
jgi:uncharacterized protein (TIGR04255 family)